MKDQLSADLLEKYFAGDCSEQEKAVIGAWYASFEDRPDDVSGLSADEQRLFKAIMLDNINNNIKAAESEDKVVPFYSNRSGGYKSLIYWASGVAAVLLVAFFIKYRLAPVRVLKSADNSQLQTFTNITNTIRKITLSDGSSIWVSPQSTLTYLKSFEKSNRKVSLKGEAFFEVTKNPERPFLIYTGKVVTRVWGTSFRIKAYDTDKTIKVDVVTGKVSVSVGDNNGNNIVENKSTAVRGDGVMLLPSQEAVYNRVSDDLQKNMEIKDASIAMWKKASLSFNNTPLPEVFKILNKNFNVKISSKDDSINSDNLKADFTNENLPTIIEILKKTLNVSYRVNGNEFVLESNNK